jgi:hypothetical protein
MWFVAVVVVPTQPMDLAGSWRIVPLDPTEASIYVEHLELICESEIVFYGDQETIGNR